MIEPVNLSPYKNLKELKTFRLANSKTFLKVKTEKGEKRKFVKWIGHVHYKNNYDDSSEAWKDIDLEIKKKGKKFVISKAIYDLEIFSDVIGYSYNSKRDGKVIVKLKSLNGVPVSDLDLKINPELDGNRLWWKNVFQDIDIYIQALPLRVRCFKVLKTNKAPVKLEWDIYENEKGKARFKRETNGIDKEKRKIRLENNIVKLEKTKDKLNHFVFGEEFKQEVAVIKDKKTRVKEWSKSFKYPVIIDADVDELITVDEDDGKEWIKLSDWQYEVGSVMVGAYTTNTYYNGGIRFQGIAIPNGATIDTAVLKLNISYFNNNPIAKIYGDDVDDAASWSISNRPSQIIKTTAYKSWTPSATGLSTVDIKNIIEEILSRDGWASGNDLRIGFINNATPGTVNIVGFHDYYDGGAETAANLEIDYTVASTITNRNMSFLSLARITNLA